MNRCFDFSHISLWIFPFLIKTKVCHALKIQKQATYLKIFFLKNKKFRQPRGKLLRQDLKLLNDSWRLVANTICQKHKSAQNTNVFSSNIVISFHPYGVAYLIWNNKVDNQNTRRIYKVLYEYEIKVHNIKY